MTELRQGHNLIYAFLNEDLAAVLCTNNWWCLKEFSAWVNRVSERVKAREAGRMREINKRQVESVFLRRFHTVWLYSSSDTPQRDCSLALSHFPSVAWLPFFSPSPTQKALLLQNLHSAQVPGSTVPLQALHAVFTGLASVSIHQKFSNRFSCWRLRQE